ncbi:MAG: methyltransferase domain-containing protein [Methanomassiliicoccales archaeon]
MPLFDKIARDYDSLRWTEWKKVEFWGSLLADRLSLHTGDTLLDAGCGTGTYTSYFARSGICTIGTDISNEMLLQAVAKKGDCQYARADASLLPFRDESFQAVTAIMMIHHLSSEMRRRFFSEAMRVLKNGGRISLITEGHMDLRQSLWCLFPRVMDIDMQRFPSTKTVVTETMKAGFNPVKSERITGKFGKIDLKEVISRAAKKHLSTFHLMSEEEFASGLSIFECRLNRKYGTEVPDEQHFTLITGVKGEGTAHL